MYKITLLILAGIFLSFFSITSWAQTILILDKSSGLPVPDVAIFNQKMNKAVITDGKGTANIEVFSDNDSLYFQHPSYKRLTILKASLEKSGNTIQLEKEVRMLEEFVIAVKRWEQVKEEVPNKIKSITSKELQFQNPQTAADLLTISNAVFLQKSQLGGGSPMIRGFAANSVLLVIDGVRMNNAIYRSGNIQNVISLDANIIQESEIIYGPGSVVYGSDALGGVMDFHTFEPVLSKEKKSKVIARAGLRYSTANSEKMGHFDLNAGFNKWAFLTSITYSDYSDLQMGGWDHPSYQRNEYAMRIGNKDSIITNTNPDIQVFSGFNQLNLTQKFRFSPKEKINFTYAFHFSESSNIPRYDRLIQYSNNELKYAEWYYGPQKWMMHSLSSQFDNKTFLSDNIKIILAYQNYSESRHDRKLYDSSLRHRFENVDIFSINIDVNKKLGKKHSIYYGIESFLNDVSSTANSEDIISGDVVPESSRYPDGINYYFTFSAYTSIKLNVTKKLTFDAGLRYNYIDLYSTIVDNSFYNFSFNEIKNTNSAFNGSAGLVYRPVKGSQINFNFSTGFRAPNLDDIAKVFDSEPGRVVVPNEDLKPEYAYNLDLGWMQNFNTKVKFEISGFYTLLKDAMVRREYQLNGQEYMLYDGEISQVLAVVNTREATIYGGSIDLVAKLSKSISFKTDFTYMKGKDDEGRPLRHIPPYYGGIHLQYESSFINGDFYFLYNGKITNNNLAPEEQSKTYMYELDEAGLPYSPSWYTLNFKMSIKPTKFVTVQGGIENILNVRYRPYSSGIVAPGRNIFVALKIAIG